MSLFPYLHCAILVDGFRCRSSWPGQPTPERALPPASAARSFPDPSAPQGSFKPRTALRRDSLSLTARSGPSSGREPLPNAPFRTPEQTVPVRDFHAKHPPGAGNAPLNAFFAVETNCNVLSSIILYLSNMSGNFSFQPPPGHSSCPGLGYNARQNKPDRVFQTPAR